MGALYLYTAEGNGHKGHTCKVDGEYKDRYNSNVLVWCYDCGSYFLGTEEALSKVEVDGRGSEENTR